MTKAILKTEWFGLDGDSLEPLGPFPSAEAAEQASMASTRLMALDRSSARSYDADGHLHIARTRITKANVCPYRGKEIPHFEELGLDPDRIYQLYRDPDELAKAAKSFNNKPLLSKHQPITIEEPNRDLWAGCLGGDAEYEHPYLYNSLAVWDKPSIKGIEDESKRELSAGYRYRADMTPGEIGGIRYDGVMRDLVGNHVAFVEEGRAGADVMAADSKLKQEPIAMKTALKSRKALLLAGAATGLLRPKLAQDSKLDLSPAFAGITAKNFPAKKTGVVAAIRKEITGKLADGIALDAAIEDVVKLLDACEGDQPAGVDEVPEAAISPNAGVVPIKNGNATDEEDPEAKRKAFLAEKLSAEDMAAYDAMCPGKKEEIAPAQDEEDEEAKKKREAEEKAAEDKKMKGAMDAAIAKSKAEIIAEQRAIREAEKAVRPRVGDLEIAADSASDVYGAALTHLGVKIDGIPKQGLRAMFEALPAPERHRRSEEAIAMDGAQVKSFSERFPGADRIAIAS